MSLPRWNDPALKAGTMVRGGLWLVEEIGVGNTFTKEQVRSVFPGVSQADRRIRDLRAYGWVLASSTQDASLLPEEQRLVKVGIPVWDAAARRGASPQTMLSNKEQAGVFARDEYMCTTCGIAGGETYPDDSNQMAVLAITRRETVMPSGVARLLLLTECKRCRAGSDASPARADEVGASIRGLSSADQERIRRWMKSGRRDTAPIEHVWSNYRRLPAEARDEMRQTLLGT